MQRLFIIALVLVLGAGLAATPSARAGAPAVTSTNDDGPGSLRAAIAAAAPGAFLVFDETMSGKTITLNSGIVIDKNLSIAGPSGKTTIEMAADGNVFTIDGDVDISELILDGLASGSKKGIQQNSGDLQLLRMEITNFRDSPTGGGGLRSEDGTTGRIADSTISFNTAGAGGAIRNGSAPLVLERVRLIGNSTAGEGGAIHNDGEILMSDVTIFKNGALGNGGGIDNNENMVIRDSTINGNSSAENGGGIFTDAGRVEITNSTISGNFADEGGGIYQEVLAESELQHVTITANSADNVGGGIRHIGTGEMSLAATIVAHQALGGDCEVTGPFTSVRYNLDSDGSCPLNSGTDIQNGNAMLGELELNAPGITETHALLPGSDAIDVFGAADGCATNFTEDQRGVTRPQGGLCDIGAYETTDQTTTRRWGDINCDGTVDSQDVLPPLAHIGGVAIDQPSGCPAIDGFVQIGSLIVRWSDLDCDTEADEIDALDLVLVAAQVPKEQTVTGCPHIGESVEVIG